MMGHGIGMVETIAGLDRFLVHANRLMSRDGQVLFDTVDTDNASNLAYQEANRRAGRYMSSSGMSRKQGAVLWWLHVDPETLKEHARTAGWQYDIIIQKRERRLPGETH